MRRDKNRRLIVLIAILVSLATTLIFNVLSFGLPTKAYSMPAPEPAMPRCNYTTMTCNTNGTGAQCNPTGNFNDQCRHAKCTNMVCNLVNGGTKANNECTVGDNKTCIDRICDDASKTCKAVNKGTPGTPCTVTPGGSPAGTCVHKKCDWTLRQCNPLAWMPGGSDQCTTWSSCVRYACQDPATNTCVEAESGFPTMSDCQNACTDKYSCLSTMSGYVCAKDKNGTYNQTDCYAALANDCQPQVGPTPPGQVGPIP